MNQNSLSKLTTDEQKLELFGTTVQVQTSFEETIIGQLFFTDEKCIILKNDQQYYYIKQDLITHIQTTTTQGDNNFEKLMQELIKDTNSHIKDSAEQNLRAAIARVTPREQILFDHLTRMYKDTQWEMRSIVIPSLKIKISEPYDARDACNSTDQGKKALERVKKMITKLWETKPQ